MWGPGPWMVPMWGFGLDIIGLLIFVVFVICVLRMITIGGHFMSMGPHHQNKEETARLRREIEELQEQVKKQEAAR